MADFDLTQTDAQVQSILNDAQNAQGAGAQTTLTTDYIMLKEAVADYYIYYSVKDETKISSIQEYDIETGKIVTISIYKRDGKTISIVKRIDPKTDKVTNWINDKVEVIERNDKIFTRNYDNMKFDDEEKSENIASLIDNLYRKELKFENI